jgi:hypothetical protein
MLLFGAGASIEAKVPGAYKMTEAIAERFRQNPSLRKHAHVISFVIGGLLFEAGKNNLNPLSAGVNVEDLFNAVQLLAGTRSRLKSVSRLWPEASDRPLQVWLEPSILALKRFLGGHRPCPRLRYWPLCGFSSSRLSDGVALR